MCVCEAYTVCAVFVLLYSFVLPEQGVLAVQALCVVGHATSLFL